MNKKLLVATVATGAVVFGGLAATGTAFASEETFRPMMERFAERLGVTTEEAQEAWDETHDEMQTERLTELGLSEEQIEMLTEKREAFRLEAESIKDQELTATERQEKMESLREEFRVWAEENDIPAGMVNGGGMMGRGSHGGMVEGRRGLNSDGECLNNTSLE